MSVYLDTNAVVGLLLPDALNTRVLAAIDPDTITPVVSDLAAAEYAAVVTRRLRMKAITQDVAQMALLKFDTWCSAYVERTEHLPADIRTAGALVRRFDLALRAPDAIHLATAGRLSLQLLTFDHVMLSAADTLGIPVVPI